MTRAKRLEFRDLVKIVFGMVWTRIISGLRLYYFVIRKYQKEVKRVSTLEDALQFATSFKSLGIQIKPLQRPAEIRKLLSILTELRPTRVLEIGTADGGTLFLFTRIASPDADIISVDLPERTTMNNSNWKLRFYGQFSRDNQHLSLIRANSQDSLTAGKVSKILDGKLLDFLFLDADHSYEGVKRDYELYSTLVRKNGLIAFHDITPKLGYGVNQLWNELKESNQHTEIVEDWNSSEGIGILTK